MEKAAETFESNSKRERKRGTGGKEKREKRKSESKKKHTQGNPIRGRPEVVAIPVSLTRGATCGSGGAGKESSDRSGPGPGPARGYFGFSLSIFIFQRGCLVGSLLAVSFPAPPCDCELSGSPLPWKDLGVHVRSPQPAPD
jgi:hypothetical protein